MNKYIKVFLTIVTIFNYNINNVIFSEQITERTTSGFDDDDLIDDYYDGNNSIDHFLIDETNTFGENHTFIEQSNKNKMDKTLLQNSNALKNEEIYNIEYNILPLEKLNEITITINNKIKEINNCIVKTFKESTLNSTNNDSLFWANIGKRQSIIVQLFNITEKILSSDIKDSEIILDSLLEFYLFVVNDIKRLNTEYLKYINKPFSSIKSKFDKSKQNSENLQALIKSLNKCINDYVIPELKNVLPKKNMLLKDDKITDQDKKIQKIVNSLDRLHKEIGTNINIIKNRISSVFDQSNANTLQKRLDNQYNKLHFVFVNIKMLTKGHIDIEEQNEIQKLFKNYKLCLDNLNNFITTNYKLIIKNTNEEEEKYMKDNSKFSTFWLKIFNEHIMNEDNSKLIKNYGWEVL